MSNHSIIMAFCHIFHNSFISEVESYSSEILFINILHYVS